MKAPILLLIFNRPKTTQVVFDEIRRAKPKKLFIAADGPRANRVDDVAKCEDTRKITELIDWPCTVERLYRKVNLGCGVGPSDAISWFFNNVDSGIILEDDCVPDQSFFKFCDELLEKYEDDKRIMMISGDNFQDKNTTITDSYYFSRHCHCWGWATWKRAWNLFDFNMSSWPTFKKRNNLLELFDGNCLVSKYWESVFNYVYKGKKDIWDYQWTYACVSNGGMTILPAVNLVTNIGVGEGATHTARRGKSTEIPSSSISFPLKHPKLILRNKELDYKTDKNYFLTPRVIGGLIYRKIFIK